MKLTIMQMCRIRCSRVNRMNWRSAFPALGIGTLLAWPSCRRCLGMLFGGVQFPAHLESARQPEQRMHSADHECSQEQCSHAPEGKEQEWVLARVVVRGVRQVSCEPPRCTRMAFLAGRRHVRAAEVRPWVRNRKHIVSSVA